MNLSQIPQWLQIAGIVLGAIYAIATIVSGVFATLAGLFPGVVFFARVSSAFGTLGVDIQKVLAVMGKGDGGSRLPLVFLCIGLGALGSSVSGCALLTPKRLHGFEAITICVLEHRSLTPEAIAKECAVDDAQDVVDIIAGADRRAAAARAVGCK